MRVLICGSRDWEDRQLIRSWIWEHLHPGDVVINGAQRGVDAIAGEEAAEVGLEVRPFPAEWERFKTKRDPKGRAAGPARNQRMLDEGNPSLVVAFHWDPGLGTGTANMVHKAASQGVPCNVYIRPGLKPRAR